MTDNQKKESQIDYFDRLAPMRQFWRERNRYYYEQVDGLVAQNVSPDDSVLEIGCATGDLLASLALRRGVGVDFSPEMIRSAREKWSEKSETDIEFKIGDAEALALNERFDRVIMSDVVGELDDVWSAFRNLHGVTHERSRIVITYFNHLWEPILWLGERLGLKTPQHRQNWLSLEDLEHLLEVTGFEVIRRGYRLLLPKKIPLLAPLFNRYLVKLPLLRRLGLVLYLVARPRPKPRSETSVSVIIPCRNERGNIRSAIERTPEMGRHTEIIFVDGNSNDGTVEEIEAVIHENGGRRDIKLIHQLPRGSMEGAEHGRMLKLGKGDAVRKGFAAASGDILMILDGDLTVPPEDLPKFYLALVDGYGEFVNGSRLVYPMEKEAMRLLNKIANKMFSIIFTWILEQPVKDTLCGTKVLRRIDYEQIARQRDYFGDFDPFGDFDLLFGAARQNMKIIEIPIRYRERTYGEIKIRRFQHGVLLLKMTWVGMQKLKWRV